MRTGPGSAHLSRASVPGAVGIWRNGVNEQRDEGLPGPGLLGALEGTLWAVLGPALGPGTLCLWLGHGGCSVCLLHSPALLRDSQGMDMGPAAGSRSPWIEYQWLEP